MYTVNIKGYTTPLYLKEVDGKWYLTKDVTDDIYMSETFNDAAATILGVIVYGDKKRPFQDSVILAHKGSLRVRSLLFEPKVVDLDLSKVNAELRVGREVFISIDDCMMHVSAGAAHLYCTKPETKVLAWEDFKSKQRSDCQYQVIKVNNLVNPDIKAGDILFPFSEYSGLVVNECYEVIEPANVEALVENLGCKTEEFDYFIVKKQ